MEGMSVYVVLVLDSKIVVKTYTQKKDSMGLICSRVIVISGVWAK